MTIVNQTTNVTNITYNNTTIVNEGPNYNELRGRTQRPIERLRLQRQTVNVEAEIPLEPDPRLRIGMAMDVKINTGQKDKALLIPRSAVVRRGPDLLVSVVNGKVVEERPVQLGGFEGQVVEVLKGLKPGEVVVVGKE